MGLSSALTGGIMMTMIVIVLIMAIPAIVSANISTNRAYSERAQLDNGLSKTSINIDSIQTTALNNTVIVNLSNAGSNKLWNYDKFNLIVTYDSTTGLTAQRNTESLNYAGIISNASIPVGSWGITKFTNDGLDPQILNPNESIEITCKLNDNTALDGFLAVILSTDNGAITSNSVVIS